MPDLQGQFLRGVGSSVTRRDPDSIMRTLLKPGVSSQGVGSFQYHATYINEAVNITLPNSQLWLQVGVDIMKMGFDLSAVNTDTVEDLFGVDKETRPINVAVHYYIKCASISGII